MKDIILKAIDHPFKTMIVMAVIGAAANTAIDALTEIASKPLISISFGKSKAKGEESE